MKIEGLIAVRYLFSRKQRSVVNVISWISLIGLMVSTMALIIVLSVYNGIGDITKSLFNTFDPEIVIEPAEGRTFHLTDIDMRSITSMEEVEKETIRKALEKSDGNRKAAAGMLNLSERTLYRKIKEYGL